MQPQRKSLPRTRERVQFNQTNYSVQAMEKAWTPERRPRQVQQTEVGARRRKRWSHGLGLARPPSHSTAESMVTIREKRWSMHKFIVMLLLLAVSCTTAAWGEGDLHLVATGSNISAKVTSSKLQETVRAEDYGFSAAATATTNAANLRRAIAIGSRQLTISTPGDYALDNRLPLELNVAGMHFMMGPGVNIRPSVNTAKVFFITAKNVVFEGGMITGDGTHNIQGSSSGRPIAFVEVYNGESPVAPQTVKVRNVSVVDPNNAGILFYRTVGGEATGNKLRSTYSGGWIQGVLGISVYSSAQVLISGNLIDGFVQNIAGGAEDAGGYTFNDFASEANHRDTRDVIIQGNQLVNFSDHGFYFSSNTHRVTVRNNRVASSVATAASGIKLFGSGVIDGNTVDSVLGGIDGRNSYQLTISNNRVNVTGSSRSVTLINLDITSAYDIHAENISITNNQLHAASSRGTNKGIYINGMRRKSNGSQNLLKNISITGNVFSGTIGGVFGGSYNAVIHLYQETSAKAVSSAYGQNITISNNSAHLMPTTGPAYNCLYFLMLSGLPGQANFDNVVITGNKASNFVGDFMYLGIRKGLVENNFAQPQRGNGAIRRLSETGTSLQ
jgi:hypothetical protein